MNAAAVDSQSSPQLLAEVAQRIMQLAVKVSSRRLADVHVGYSGHVGVMRVDVYPVDRDYSINTPSYQVLKADFSPWLDDDPSLLADAAKSLQAILDAGEVITCAAVAAREASSC